MEEADIDFIISGFTNPVDWNLVDEYADRLITEEVLQFITKF